MEIRSDDAVVLTHHVDGHDQCWSFPCFTKYALTHVPRTEKGANLAASRLALEKRVSTVLCFRRTVSPFLQDLNVLSYAIKVSIGASRYSDLHVCKPLDRNAVSGEPRPFQKAIGFLHLLLGTPSTERNHLTQSDAGFHDDFPHVAHLRGSLTGVDDG